MNGYICSYNRKRLEVYAPDMFAAKKLAIEAFKVRPKQQHMITVMLAEKDGKPVIHSTSEL